MSTNTHVQEALIRHLNAIVIPSPHALSLTEAAETENLITAFLGNILNYGYKVDNTSLAALLAVKTDDVFKETLTSVLEALKTLSGDLFRYIPMYPDFPNAVATATEAQIVLNNFLLANGVPYEYIHNYSSMEKRRVANIPDEKLKTLEVVYDTGIVNDVFFNIVTSKVSMPEVFDKDMVALFDLVEVKPEFDSVTNKENLAKYASLMIASDPSSFSKVIDQVNNPTDILRIVNTMVRHYGDATLNKISFAKLTRSQRKIIVSKLESFPTMALSDALMRDKVIWKTFGKHIHIGEFFDKNPNVKSVFTNLRSGKRLETFDSVVNEAIKSGDFRTALNTIKQRPGIFLRRLHEIATMNNANLINIVDAIYNVSPKAALSLQLRTYDNFKHYNAYGDRMYISAVSGVASFIGPVKDALSVSDSRTIASALLSGIQETISTMPSLGKVFIPNGPATKTALPFALRDSNSSARVMSRGSRMPVDTSGVLRLFTHWADSSTRRIDVDLSAVLYDSNINVVAQCSYTNIRIRSNKSDSSYVALHSGDFTSGKDGVAEFIDIDFDLLRKSYPSVRYIMPSLLSYSGIPFSEIPQSYAGYMMLDKMDAQKGQIFKPSEVNDVFAFNSEAKAIVPFLIDLENNEFVWLDVDIRGSKTAGMNVTNYNDVLKKLVEYIEADFMTVEELLCIHALTRGTIVNSVEEADIVLSVENIGLEEISSKWM